MIKTFFKDSSIDFDRTKVINTPNCIYVDGYFFPEDEQCPICNSSDLQKNGHIKRTVKHCVYYSRVLQLCGANYGLPRKPTYLFCFLFVFYSL